MEFGREILLMKVIVYYGLDSVFESKIENVYFFFFSRVI